ncbi:hypothetical protein HK104_007994 [Borealophlyctis nickersoniae]|nr:hypothetical protein HK104_007994 [Borealophlyctis nickersoniae]
MPERRRSLRVAAAAAVRRSTSYTVHADQTTTTIKREKKTAVDIAVVDGDASPVGKKLRVSKIRTAEIEERTLTSEPVDGETREEEEKEEAAEKPRRKRRSRAAIKEEKQEEITNGDDVATSPPKKKTRKTTKIEVSEEVSVDSKPAKPKKKTKQKKKKPQLASVGTDIGLAEDQEGGGEDEEEEEEEAIVIPPLDTTAMWARAHTTKKYIGAHVSAAKGVHNAILNSVRIGGTCFALFVKNQRRLISKPTAAIHITAFKEAMTAAGFTPKHILPHGSYLINVANPEEERRQQGYEVLLDDLKRCEALGIEMYNFHPGSAVNNLDRTTALSYVSDAINRAHAETKSIIILVENMAGQGAVLGSTFEELAAIIDNVTNKDRVGVCLDTCHMFAAGYDITTPATYTTTMHHFHTTVGFPFLRALHLNDSKMPLGSRKDRHENIGKGCIGLDGFRCIMNDSRLDGVPMILETPEKEGGEGYRKEIEILYGLVEGLGESAGE